MKRFWQIGLLMCAGVSFVFSGEVLNVSYDTWTLLQQNGAILHPDAVMTTDPIVCFDMGQSGNVELPSIALPQGPFSIESKFYLRGYNETDPNISEILSAFDCNYGGASNSEGTDLRIGGGYNYALKIQDVWNNVSDWTPPNGSDKVARAAVSKAMGEFGLGSGTNVGGHGAWKEAYTDRCIETNKWIHMVATWDGTNMLLYLNGHNATDSWRTNGSGLQAFVLPVRPVVIGAEHATSAWRHLNGKIGYVKVYNAALSSCEVWHKYKESLGSDRCVDFIRIESPRCGEVIAHDTKIKFAIRDSIDNDVTPSNQPFIVHICQEPTFSNTVRSFSTTMTECTFSDLVGQNDADFDGLLYFRISACNNSAGLPKMADSDVVAQSGTLPAFLTGLPTKITPRAVPKGITSIRQLTNEVVYDIRGRKVGVGAKVASSTLKFGVYFVKTANGTGQKLLYMK